MRVLALCKCLVLFIFSLGGSAIADPMHSQVFVKPLAEKSWSQIYSEFFGTTSFSKTYALVIGVSEYDHFARLPTTNDPKRISEYLTKVAGYDYVHVITERDVTAERVKQILQKDFRQQMDENDRLFVYWSGHGDTATDRRGNDIGFLATSYSDPNDISSLIRMSDLVDWLDFLPATQILVVLDACFSGLIGEVPQSIPDRTLSEIAQPSFEIITAGSAKQATFASYDLDGGVFTRALLEGLNGKADSSNAQFPKDGIITTTELIQYAQSRVLDYAEEITWFGKTWGDNLRPARAALAPREGEFFFITEAGKRAALDEAGYDIGESISYGWPEIVGLSERTNSPTTTESLARTRCLKLAASSKHPQIALEDNVPYLQIPTVEAVTTCDFAHSLDPNDDVIAYHFGRAMLRDADLSQNIELYKEAKYLLSFNCERGDMPSCTLLGNTVGTFSFAALPDHDEAFELYSYACSENYEAACLEMINPYRSGLGTVQNAEHAFELAAEYCSKNVQTGCVHQSYALSRGLGVERDIFKAYELALDACSKDNAWGCERTGIALRDGVGVGKDLSTAFEYFSKSCELHNQYACRQVSIAYRDGSGVTPNLELSRTQLIAYCENGDWDACTVTGIGLETGKSGTLNTTAAQEVYSENCQRGSEWACARLGYVYEQGLSGKIDLSEAYSNYDLACQGGSNWGCIRQAYLYRDGDGVAEDDSKALEILKFQCLLGELQACVAVGYQIETGQGVDIDFETAAEIYEENCELNSGWACSRLARIFEKGRLGEINNPEAFLNYQKGCDLNNNWGCNRAGYFLRDGIGVQEDDIRALALFQKTCNDNHANGCAWLGYMHETGQGLDTVNYHKAHELYEQACDKNSAWGCARLGNLYEEDLIGSHDYDIAFKHFSRACELKSDWGCEELGRLYRDGRGTERNTTMAVKIFNDLCDNGYPDGCTHVGYMHEYGEGIPQDEETAIQIYVESCEKGSGWACDNMGDVFWYGLLREKDSSLAYDYYKRSCDLGHYGGCRSYANILLEPDDHTYNPSLARDILHKNCNSNDAEACHQVGKLISEENPAEATRYFEQGCELNSSSACGSILDNHISLKEFEAAYQFSVQLCEDGIGDMCVEAARIIEDGHLGYVSHLEMFDLHSRACERNVPFSCDLALRLRLDNPNLNDFLQERQRCSTDDILSCMLAAEKIAHPFTSKNFPSSDPDIERLVVSDPDALIASLLRWRNPPEACYAVMIGDYDYCTAYAALLLFHDYSASDIEKAKDYLRYRCLGNTYEDHVACEVLFAWQLTNLNHHKPNEDLLNFARDRCEKNDGEVTHCLSSLIYNGFLTNFYDIIDHVKIEDYFRSACSRRLPNACLEWVILGNQHSEIAGPTDFEINVENLISQQIENGSRFMCTRLRDLGTRRVKQAQTLLKAAGHYNGPIDGIVGRRTEQALVSAMGCFFYRPNPLE